MSSIDTRNNRFENNLQKVEEAVQDLERWHDYELGADEAAETVERVFGLGSLASTRVKHTIPDPDPETVRESVTTQLSYRERALSKASDRLAKQELNNAVSYLVDEHGADEEQARSAMRVFERYLEVEQEVEDLQDQFEENYGDPDSIDEDHLLDTEEDRSGFKRWVVKRDGWAEVVTGQNKSP